MTTPDTLDDLSLPVPTGYQVPFGYEVTRHGVWLVKESRDGEVKYRVAWAPLVVSKVFVDAAGDQQVELAWIDRGRVVTRIVPRSIAKRGKHLVATLGDAGLPVIDADARLAERWLAAVEAANRPMIEQRYLARQLGWQNDGEFVTSQDTPHRVEVKYDEQIAPLAAHHPAGTLDGWQAAIKRMGPYPVAQVALFAGFAAPLLDVLGLDSFAVDLYSRSTRGKTISASAGLSLWADPAEKGDAMYSWRTTMLAAEKRLNLVRGLPVVIDETKLVRDPEIVHNLIYQLPKNHGQARGGGWPSRLPWRTVVISTGEQSLLTYTTDQGAGARILTVQGAPFGTDGAHSAAAAEEVRSGCESNYGVAGPAFVEQLRAGLAERNGPNRLIARHKQLVEAYRGETDLSARRAPMVACLALAAELAHKWGILPFPPPSPAAWTELLVASEEMFDDRPEMALDLVREYVASQGRALWSPHTNDPPPFSGWIGRHIRVDGKPTVALLPERLKEQLRNGGYELDAVIHGWRERGVLVENDSYRPPYLIKKGIDGQKARMYIFAPGHVVSSETDTDDGE